MGEIGRTGWFHEDGRQLLSYRTDYGRRGEQFHKAKFTIYPDGGLECPNRAGGVARVHDLSGVVGEALPAGTWKSEPGIDDCYWEKATASGETIENHFGLSGGAVTLSDGQQFKFEGCGYWYRQ